MTWPAVGAQSAAIFAEVAGRHVPMLRTAANLAMIGG